MTKGIVLSILVMLFASACAAPQPVVVRQERVVYVNRDQPRATGECQVSVETGERFNCHDYAVGPRVVQSTRPRGRPAPTGECRVSTVTGERFDCRDY